MHLQNLFGRENANFIGQENTNCEENSQKSSWEPYGLYSLFHSFIETKINAKRLLYLKATSHIRSVRFSKPSNS